MARNKFKNNAVSTLASGINSSQGTITLATGTGSKFPTLSSQQFFYATLINQTNFDEWEIVYVYARSGDTITAVRGQQGTSARSWPAGTMIVQYITAGDTYNLVSRNTLVSQYVQPPIATIVPYAGSTIPTDYLECNGQVCAILDYPFLYDVIGTTYGTTNASLNFLVPDLRNLFLRAINTDASGHDPNRGYNTVQADAFHGHNHELYYYQSPYSHAYDPHFSDYRSMGDYSSSPLITGYTGGSETAPYHTTVKFIIKASW